MKFSIKTKIFAIVTLAILASVTSYFFFAVKTFREDKMAYVYETTLSSSVSLSSKVSDFLAKALRETSLLGVTKGVNGRFEAPLDKGIFSSNPDLLEFMIFSVKEENPEKTAPEATPEINEIFQLRNEKKLGDKIPPLSLPIKEILKKTQLVWNASAPGFPPNIGVAVYNKNSKEIFFSRYSLEDLVSLFAQNKIFKSYLIDKNKRMILSDNMEDVVSARIFPENFIGSILQNSLPNGVLEVMDSKNKGWLVGFSRFDDYGFSLMSMISKDNASSAIQYLKSRSMIFAVFLISGGFLLAIFTASSLTGPIFKLYDGTKEVAKGNFEVQIKPSSKDEIADLTDSFNFMAKEIKRYIQEVGDKVRMEKELAVAQLVQSSFYPKDYLKTNKLELYGHHATASECGGDWWGYLEANNKILFYIGDATGHGVPAALMTATAHCCVQLLEKVCEFEPNFISFPDKILAWMNHAIHKSGGQILMTFFIGIFDNDTKKLTYASASHNPPLLYKKGSGDPSKEDIETLMEGIGPRLGQELDASFSKGNVQLKGGDAILLFTDGIVEGANPEGKPWGERRFVKSFVSHLDKGPEDVVNGLLADSKEYYQGVAVDDDVTLVAVRIIQ